MNVYGTEILKLEGNISMVKSRELYIVRQRYSLPWAPKTCIYGREPPIIMCTV